jgi:DNA repair protein RadC
MDADETDLPGNRDGSCEGGEVEAKILIPWEQTFLLGLKILRFLRLLRPAFFTENFPRVFGVGFAYKFFMFNSMKLKDQPAGERPRERLAALGADALSNAELIAILLRTGLKGMNAVEIGKHLVQKFGTLQSLAQVSVADLQKVRGIGRDKAVTLVAAFALARKMAVDLRTESPVLETPEVIVGLLREDNRLLQVETLQVVLLNARHRLIRVEIISQGTLDTILVHPREVFKAAIAANAAALVLAHNHPSGDPTPSAADIKVTRDLIRAGQLLKIEVLDHIILGRATPERTKEYSSLRELGYFYA